MAKKVILLGLLGWLVIVPAVLLLGGSLAGAEPYIATRTGFKCSVCHVNRTGGGKRTDFGLIYSQTNLSMKIVRSSDGPSFVNGRVNQVFSVGADFRAENVSIFEYEDSTGAKASSSNQSRVSEANVYLQMDMIPGVFALYADQILSPISANREFFGLLQDSNGNAYAKIGRMLLPYGLRLLDDAAFIRSRTGYTYNRHDLGAEVGLEPGPISLMMNVTDTQLSAVGSVVFRRFRVGSSYGRSTQRSKEHTWGAFGGANFGRFTLLGEIDFITEADIDRFASLAELNVLITRGFNLKATYEFFDRNTDVSNDRDGQERITLGIEPFLIQYLQIGLFYRINRFVPQALTENQDELRLQFHGFF